MEESGSRFKKPAEWRGIFGARDTLGRSKQGDTFPDSGPGMSKRPALKLAGTCDEATARVSSYLSPGAEGGEGGSDGGRVVPLGSLAVPAYNVAIAADRRAGHV